MVRCTKSIAILVVAGVLASGAGLAQGTPPAKPPPPPTAAPTTTTEKVKEISRREWNALKVKWAKEKDKWASCRKQAREKKLYARKRWTFISVCMTQ
jgi:hypothetical protein